MNKMDKVKTGLEIHLIHTGDDMCARCPYVGKGAACCEDLFHDTMELLNLLPEHTTLPSMRFLTSTGDVFTVTEVFGPSCDVRQERTGYTFRYDISILRNLPVTWEGGTQDET